MIISRIFKTKSKTFFTLMILLGIVNSITSSGLLILINNSITGKTSFYNEKYSIVLFFGIMLVSIVCSRVFQYYVVNLTNEILFKFEMDVLQKLRQAEFEAFEKLGTERVYTAIGDTRALGRIPETFINAFNSAIVVICCLIYLLINSPMGGGMILGLMLILLAVYLKRNKRIEKQLNKLRDLQNDYYRYLNDMLHGFKEIKMGIKRTENIFGNYLKQNRGEEKRLGTITAIKYLDNELMGSYSWYIILGLIMYILPMVVEMEIAQVSTFIITILYIIGPTSTLITMVPFFTRVKIAFERINEYEDTVSAFVKPRVGTGNAAVLNDRFQILRFDEVAYEYSDKLNHKTFGLGPINLEIVKGEVMFVVGGNGSGKSTFINLLTGLYKPSSGSLYLNEKKVDHDSYAFYSDKISVIFTKNHLFGENYEEFDLTPSNEKLRFYIEEMQLTNVIKTNENNWISNDLSKGQQKRLAMVYAFMEDKDMLVLDEWAAEQDPEFRAYFYHHLIPSLQKMGKTVIAVTHDDAYFSCADRVVKFDYGRIVEDTRHYDIFRPLASTNPRFKPANLN